MRLTLAMLLPPRTTTSNSMDLDKPAPLLPPSSQASGVALSFLLMGLRLTGLDVPADPHRLGALTA